MEDRLKYRFWHKPSKKMLDCYGFNEHYTFADTLDGIGTEYNPCKTKDCVLMQCTGLKDKNGKLIYEGDIIKLNEKYPDYTATDDFFKNQNYAVEFFQPQAKFLLKPSEYRDNSGDGICELSPDFYEFLNWDVNGIEYYVLQGIEVIGNAFENPELLAKDGDNEHT